MPAPAAADVSIDITDACVEARSYPIPPRTNSLECAAHGRSDRGEWVLQAQNQRRCRYLLALTQSSTAELHAMSTYTLAEFSVFVSQWALSAPTFQFDRNSSDLVACPCGSSSTQSLFLYCINSRFGIRWLLWVSVQFRIR